VRGREGERPAAGRVLGDPEHYVLAVAGAHRLGKCPVAARRHREHRALADAAAAARRGSPALWWCRRSAGTPFRHDPSPSLVIGARRCGSAARHRSATAAQAQRTDRPPAGGPARTTPAPQHATRHSQDLSLRAAMAAGSAASQLQCLRYEARQVT
jgi:hypothetical protein